VRPAGGFARYVKDGYSLVTPAMTATLDALVREIEEENVSSKSWATPGATPPARHWTWRGRFAAVRNGGCAV